MEINLTMNTLFVFILLNPRNVRVGPSLLSAIIWVVAQRFTEIAAAKEICDWLGRKARKGPVTAEGHFVCACVT